MCSGEETVIRLPACSPALWAEFGPHAAQCFDSGAFGWVYSRIGP
jgi:hypothetical protein